MTETAIRNADRFSLLLSLRGQNGGELCHRSCPTGLWLHGGSDHMKSVPKIEKAASETGKGWNYEADLKG